MRNLSVLTVCGMVAFAATSQAKPYEISENSVRGTHSIKTTVGDDIAEIKKAALESCGISTFDEATLSQFPLEVTHLVMTTQVFEFECPEPGKVTK